MGSPAILAGVLMAVSRSLTRWMRRCAAAFPHPRTRGVRRLQEDRTMTMLPADCKPIRNEPPADQSSRLERILRIFSVLTMVLTIPQVLSIWVGGNAGGVSLVSWGAYFCSACL